MTEHVSDLQWDRMLAGELGADAAEAVRAHGVACAACGARRRGLEAARAAPLPPLVRPVARPRRRWRALAAPAGALAAAAVVVVVIVARRGGPGPDAGERSKGDGPALLLSAGRPGALVPLASGDAIHAGEWLQAGYTAARDGFGAVLARDGAGQAMAYVPAAGDAMVALPAGVERSFPASTLLDDVTGDERVAIVWCERARPLGPLLAALRAGAPLAAPDGCALRELALAKRARPR